MLKLPWLIPGANSQQVTAVAQLAMPGAGTSLVQEYVVQQGLIFSLRGFVVNVIDPSGTWIEGSGQIKWTLQVVGSGGTRSVQGLINLQQNVGSRLQPYPILGRSEFMENDKLQWVAILTGAVTAGSPQFLVSHLIGHTYPAQECER